MNCQHPFNAIFNKRWANNRFVNRPDNFNTENVLPGIGNRESMLEKIQYKLSFFLQSPVNLRANRPRYALELIVS